MKIYEFKFACSKSITTFPIKMCQNDQSCNLICIKEINSMLCFSKAQSASHINECHTLQLSINAIIRQI